MFEIEPACGACMYRAWAMPVCPSFTTDGVKMKRKKKPNPYNNIDRLIYHWNYFVHVRSVVDKMSDFQIGYCQIMCITL